MSVENPAPAEPTRAGQTYLKHGVGSSGGGRPADPSER